MGAGARAAAVGLGRGEDSPGTHSELWGGDVFSSG